MEQLNKPEFILFFESIDSKTKSKVGGKNASLAEMYQHLRDKGINIPYGFAITTDAYDRFIEFNGLGKKIQETTDNNGLNIRNLILSGIFPVDLQDAICDAYRRLCNSYKDQNVEVAVRSSSIGEDSETNSFAGQQDTYLNIQGYSSVLYHVKRCFSSLFTDRVISYRKEVLNVVLVQEGVGVGDDGEKIPKMSVCVQKMVRSDLGTSGVCFTADTESGFKDAIIINASYGLGETIVGGLVDPDEYTIFKGTMAIIDKKLGSKKAKMVYSTSSSLSPNPSPSPNPSRNRRDSFDSFDSFDSSSDSSDSSDSSSDSSDSSVSLETCYSLESFNELANEDKNFHKSTTMILETSEEERNTFCLTNEQIEKLGHWALIIENHYMDSDKKSVFLSDSDKKSVFLSDSDKKLSVFLSDSDKKLSVFLSDSDKKLAIDIEWAIDGISNELFIVQARPITTLKSENRRVLRQYRLEEEGKKLLVGVAVGEKIASGKVVKMRSVEDITKIPFEKGDVLVVDSTTPDWEPVMKMASAIITNRGGRTCHAAIIAREQGIAAIVGTDNGLDILENESIVTVSCAEGEVGNVYEGRLSWEELEIDLESLRRDSNQKPQIMFNLASPELAFKTSMLPNSGIGLAREEFIINNFIKIHPLALLNYKDEDLETRTKIDKYTIGYNDVLEYYVEKLAFGIAKIGAAFYPNDVIVRFSDFKSNEYRNLLGGKKYEPIEENPMIGWRGASRYYSQEFSEAFGLECKAIKRVREQMGLSNVVVMIPFCRTPLELLKVYDTMKVYGLQRGLCGLRVFLMAEVPSNWALADEFSKHIDGFSIGSNDMTQLVLGLDRDSHLVSHIYDERNPAVKRVIKELIQTAKRNNVKIGICGQACSDFEDFLEFLIECEIDSISITSDSLIKVLKMLNKSSV